MKGLNFEIGLIPLAIQSRFDELDRLISSLEDQNTRTESDIAALREKIEAHKKTIVARGAEIDEIRRERDILAFAVQAYQDEMPKEEPFIVPSVPAAETDGGSRTVMDRVHEEAMLNPGTAKEIADRIGIDIRHTAAALSTLAKRGRIPHIGTIWGGALPPQGQ